MYGGVFHRLEYLSVTFTRFCPCSSSSTTTMADRSRSTAKDTQSSGSRFDGGVMLSGISYDKDLYSEDKSQYLDTAPGDDEEEDYDPMPGKRSLVSAHTYDDINFKVGSYGPTREMREEYTEEGAGPPSIDALLERQDSRTIRIRLPAQRARGSRSDSYTEGCFRQ